MLRIAEMTAPTATAATARLYFVDHLRVALTILVVLHHMALTYSLVAPWYYIDPPTSEAVSLLLGLFVLLNQAYFMGLFFLISSYFAPASYDRKGPRKFLWERVVRLGVPILLFVLVLGPLAMLPAYEYVNATAAAGETIPYWHFYLGSIGPGPLWFLELLLLFSVLYALWRRLSQRGETQLVVPYRSIEPDPARAPSALHVFLFITLLALVTFLWRIWVPLGTNVPVVAFPTPSHLPQYIAFFVAGIFAYRRNWLFSVSNKAGRMAFGAAALATLAMLAMAAADLESYLTHFAGGLQITALVYAVWEAILSVSMAIALLTSFRHHFNRSNVLGRFLATHAYTVYIIHAPVIVAVAYALQGWQAHSLLKFVVASLLAIPLCFAVAWLVRSLPYADRVL